MITVSNCSVFQYISVLLVQPCCSAIMLYLAVDTANDVTDVTPVTASDVNDRPGIIVVGHWPSTADTTSTTSQADAILMVYTANLRWGHRTAPCQYIYKCFNFSSCPTFLPTEMPRSACGLDESDSCWLCPGQVPGHLVGRRQGCRVIL